MATMRGKVEDATWKKAVKLAAKYASKLIEQQSEPGGASLAAS
jgi:hypothetical protein